MNRSGFLFTVFATLVVPEAMAHAGPEAMDQHFVEHIILAALVIGLPALYLLIRLFRKEESR